MVEQYSGAVALVEGEAGFLPEHLPDYDQSAALGIPFGHMSREVD